MTMLNRSLRVVQTAVGIMLIGAAAASAQQPVGAVIPEAITVGDIFHAAVRINVPDGVRLALPDSLDVVRDVEQAGRYDVRFDTVGGSRRATILYPLSAWRPGTYELSALTLRLVDGARDSTVRVQLPPFDVTSVLPTDTAGIEPKPAKDVLGANRVWWPILLALLVAALIAVALYMWWRRRRRAEEPLVFTPDVPPLEAALEELAALQRERLIERGEFRPFYERLTAVLRHYAAAVEPRWSVDLTTSELAPRVRADMGVAEALELIRILGEADLVKFARATTNGESATRDLAAARGWIEQRAARMQSDPPEAQRAA